MGAIHKATVSARYMQHLHHADIIKEPWDVGNEGGGAEQPQQRKAR